jgi:hypothetical protein
MAASHHDLVHAPVNEKGNLSQGLQDLEVKGLVTITRTPGGNAEAVDLSAEGHRRASQLTESCDEGVEDR